MRVFCLFLCGVWAFAPLAAQHAGHHSAAKPAELHPDLGNYHHAITTKSPEAQKFFDQGLVMLYGFNHDEAARLFRRAAELDPEAPMPWWGLALAIGPNYNDTVIDAARARATHDAVREALARAANASAREQAYVRALAKRYSSDPQADWKQLNRDYSEAMRELVRRYPDDLDAATLFAESLMMLRPWQLWTPDGKPAPGTEELVAVLESVLRRNPLHPGANHFYIHAVEASPNLERAIPSAQRLATLVPGAGHLVHMPGHIYLQTGDYELAARVNHDAAESDRRYMARTGIESGMYPLMYYTHNIHFISYARAQQGRYEEALEAARQIVENVEPGVDQMQMLEGFQFNPLFVALRFACWDEVLAAPAPKAHRKLSVAFWHYARAYALAAQGKVKEAEAEKARYAAARAGVPKDALFLINNTAEAFLRVAEETLEAKLAWARGARETAIRHWRAAVEAEAALIYDEPPPWYYPVRQSLAAALLLNGQAAEAEREFRTALERKMRDGRLLFGLWQSLKAQKREDEAKFVEAEFRQAWKDATVALRLEDL
jgi:Flp pilus assembly protein TadD